MEEETLDLQRAFELTKQLGATQNKIVNLSE